MRPLLSWTTERRLEIAAAQQVVQKKRKEGQEIRRWHPIRRALNVPSATAEDPRVGRVRSNSGLLERQLGDHVGGVADRNYFKRERGQDALPV